MKKTFILAAILLFSIARFAQAGPHPHGPFPKSKPSGQAHQPHHNPHKPGPASFHTASVHPGQK